MRLDNGPTTRTNSLDHRRHEHRKPVGCRDRPALGQHFGEHHQQQRHRQRRQRHAGIAENRQQHAGCQRRGQDVDEVVADQQRADQPVLAFDQRVDRACAGIAAGFSECMRARDAAVSAVSEPEKKPDTADQGQDRQDGQPCSARVEAMVSTGS
jgi:hypothetical protein